MSRLRPRVALTLLAAGVLLIMCGLLCWQLGFDLPLHRMLRLPAPAQVRRVAALSALGGLAIMGPVALLALLVLALLRRPCDAAWLAGTIVTGRLAVEGVKLLVMRPRPPVADRLELVKSWSFPSSHSAGTMMTCVALALLFGRGRRAALALALTAAVVIGWTRVALAVHWPGDVLAGWGFGLAWLGAALLFGMKLERLAARRARSDPQSQ